MRSRKLFKRSYRSAALFFALITAVAMTTGMTGSSATGIPLPGWGEEMTKELKDAEKETKRADAWVGTSTGPLDQPALSNVGSALDTIELIIIDIFDEHVYPNLDPVDAGIVDTSVDPQTLPDYAQAIVDLAEEAVDEMENAPNGEPDCEYIGTRLKTIDALIDGYRNLAGL